MFTYPLDKTDKAIMQHAVLRRDPGQRRMQHAHVHLFLTTRLPWSGQMHRLPVPLCDSEGLRSLVQVIWSEREKTTNNPVRKCRGGGSVSWQTNQVTLRIKVKMNHYVLPFSVESTVVFASPNPDRISPETFCRLGQMLDQSAMKAIMQ